MYVCVDVSALVCENSCITLRGPVPDPTSVISLLNVTMYVIVNKSKTKVIYANWFFFEYALRQKYLNIPTTTVSATECGQAYQKTESRRCKTARNWPESFGRSLSSRRTTTNTTSVEPLVTAPSGTVKLTPRSRQQLSVKLFTVQKLRKAFLVIP